MPGVAPGTEHTVMNKRGKALALLEVQFWKENKHTCKQMRPLQGAEGWGGCFGENDTGCRADGDRREVKRESDHPRHRAEP